MKEKFDAKGGPADEGGSEPPGEVYAEARPSARPQHPGPGSNGGNGHVAVNGHVPAAKFDIWVGLDLMVGRWHWLVVGAFAGAALLYLVGLFLIRPKYTATAQLLRVDPPGISDSLKPATPMSPETFSAVIRAPEVFQKVGKQMVPPVQPELLAKWIKVDPEPDSDIINVILAAREPQFAVNVLNLYLTNAVAYTRELQAKQAGLLANEYLKKQVEQMDKDLSAAEEQFAKMPFDMTNQLSQVGGNLGRLRGELNELLLKYTEIHPLVQAKREQIKALEKIVNQAPITTNVTAAAGAGWGSTFSGSAEAFNPQLDMLNVKLRALEDARMELVRRQREATLYAEDPPGNVRIHAPANLRTVKPSLRGLKLWLATAFGGAFGLGGSIILIFLVEFVDSRLKTADDLKRVTRLPVLTSLGNLYEMAPQARAQWAFRAWTLLQGRLSPSANYGLICGITSSAPGEGRSTWISLLAEAASLTGYRVLTIATRPSPTHVQSTDGDPDELLLEEEINGSGEPVHALTTSVLSCPGQVTEKLIGQNSQPVVHIPLPGWVWNLERRKQWREALEHWRQIDNLVILVELPPACVPEAVLLGSNLPNLIWLADSGSAQAGETRAQLETLRDARCNLVGTVLNRQPGRPVKQWFPRWLSALALAATVGHFSARGQDTNTVAFPLPAAPPATAPAEPAEAQPRSFSVVSPAQRAPWQEHLTLGPGDVLNFALYGQPEIGRAEVGIGPDGRVSFLEAQDVMAAGLTVDELRNKLDQELGKYRRAAHTIIVPVSFRSKKYFMLGKVTTKGVFTLERPLTVLEALARAHGLESALVDRTLVNLTDFQHSFVARGGKRIPLDFEKLFQQGDLSQNLAVEPGDYIYFAPGDLQEVYVVGEVRTPGPVAYTPDMTIIRAITARGSYTERAYRARVLVVRGSLKNPERFAVDTHAILDAKALNFKLQPRDIIYVNSRPFIKVEEAADLAATAFIQSVIANWVGVDVVKPIQ